MDHAVTLRAPAQHIRSRCVENPIQVDCAAPAPLQRGATRHSIWQIWPRDRNLSASHPGNRPRRRMLKVLATVMARLLRPWKPTETSHRGEPRRSGARPRGRSSSYSIHV